MNKTYQVKVWRNRAYRLVKDYNDLAAAFDRMTAEKRNDAAGKYRLTRGKTVLRTV